MKKCISLLCLIVVFSGCNGLAQKPKDDDAVKYYQEQLSLVKSSMGGNSVDSNLLFKAIETLENVTLINSYVEDSDYDSSKMPVSYNFKDWKLWLEQNKANLTLNKVNNELSVVDVKPIVKDPSSLYLDYLKDLKRMKKEEHFVVQEINYIIDRLEILTGYNSIRFSSEYGCRFPTENDFAQLDKWYETNVTKMLWNKTKQQIEVTQKY